MKTKVLDYELEYLTMQVYRIRRISHCRKNYICSNTVGFISILGDGESVMKQNGSRFFGRLYGLPILVSITKHTQYGLCRGFADTSTASWKRNSIIKATGLAILRIISS